MKTMDKVLRREPMPIRILSKKSATDLPLLTMTALATALITPSTAFAQTAEEEASENDDRTIIVTARKIEEDIQDVPVSVTAFTAETFADAGLTEFSDIARLTPNLDVRPRAATGNLFATVTIRGQSSGFLTLNADQAVGININGAPITRGTSLFTNLFDIEQIEVLKGPQGTLFGKNTTGGVINVTTKAPQLGEFGGYAELTYGSFDRMESEIVLNAPLGDNAAIRLGAAATKRDGFGEGGAGESPFTGPANRTGRELANDDELFLRGSILIEPSDTLSIRLNADYHETDESSSIFRNLRTVLGGFIAVESPADDFYVGSDFRDEAPFAISDEFNINATINVDLGSAELTSITSYRDQAANTLVQSSPVTPVELGQESDIFAQELRLSGSSERLNWQVGGFYSTEEGFDVDRLSGFGLDSTTEAENQTLSVFGQGTFSLTDQLSVTGGLRYTDEERRVAGLAPGNMGQENEASFDGFSWLVGADYQPSDDILLYASISRGFRSGAIDQDNIATIVQPEFVTNYEVGFKSDLFEDVVRFNTSAFYSDYTDIQRTSFDPDSPVPVTVLRNAAEATIWGFESELQITPSDGFTFGGTLGYTNAEFDEFLDADGAGNVIDRSQEPIGGPEWQFSLNARYDAYLSDNATLGAQVNYFFIGDEQLGGPDIVALLGEEQSLVPSYSLLNAQIDLDLTDVAGVAGINVALYATNLLDKEYFTGGLALDLFGGVSNRIAGEPQQFGIRVRTDF
jgi:iron complex outermembrane receptor protein